MKLRGATAELLRAVAAAESTAAIEFVLRRDGGGSALRGSDTSRLRADEETVAGPGSQSITLNELAATEALGDPVIVVSTIPAVPDGIASLADLGSATSVTMNIVPDSFDSEFPDGATGGFQSLLGPPILSNSTTFITVIPTQIFAGTGGGAPGSGDPGGDLPEPDPLLEGTGEWIVVDLLGITPEGIPAPDMGEVDSELITPPNEGGLRDIPNQRFYPGRVRVARSFPRRVRT
jgi:hypothetical protein